MDPKENTRQVTLGAAAAAILSSAIGCLVMGIATWLSAALPAVKTALNWWHPAGPLTGETGLGVIAWLLSWVLLHIAFRKRDPNLVFVTTISLVLLVLAVVILFPPVYQHFRL